ncbi:MAG: RimK family alpha-L-glutamate ligase [Thermoanaerobaculia bacterium]
MAEITRRIGLSLGADVDWPMSFERIVEDLNLAIPIDGDTVRFEVERVTIEPFDLRQPCRYDLVLDRVTHWYHSSREWIKKAILLDDLYVLNNPWSLQAMEKHTSYCAMMRLGLPVPDTWMIPPKEYEPSPDLQTTLERYARHFDLAQVGDEIGYPLFIKPYDGGGWVGVNRIDNPQELQVAYEMSGKRLLHLQKAIEPYDLFVRCIGMGPQVRCVSYDPAAPLHERYQVAFDFLTTEEATLLGDMTLTINSFFGWDFNSCEALRSEGVFYPIDFANACPDSQVTSLHYHFPWLVKAAVRWAVFCAATDRKMRRTVDWDPYYQIADSDRSYLEKLPAYAAVARERLEADRFEEFCETHLGHLDEVAWEFFGSEAAKEAVRLKVESLFPRHEVEEFTEHFWGLLRFWRKTEGERLGLDSAAGEAGS